MEKKKLKVLHLFPEFLRGGSPVNTLRFVKATEDVLIHAAAGKKTDPELFDEYPPHAEPWDIDLTKPSLSSLLELRRRARSYRPDIIHANGKAGTFYGLLLSPFLPRKTKVFLTLRGFHDKFSGLKSLVYRTLERRDGPPSRYGYFRLPFREETLSGADQSRSCRCGGYPQRDRHQGPGTPEEILPVLKRFQVNVVSLSRITPQKDLVSMINAFGAATADRQDTALHIMGGLTHGEEEYQKEVKEALSASPAKDRVFLWGDVKQAGNLISYFDLYFSTARFEGLPTAVVEAFLSRVLVVGTDCIGNIDLIRNGEETGLLAGTGKVDEITAALKTGLGLLTSEDAAKMVNQAYKEGCEYSVENQARRLLTLYRKD